MESEKTILVVDDEPDIAALLVSLMEFEGYRAAHAASGREGIDSAIRLRPDAIFLDLSLPDIDGVQVLRAIREHEDTKGIPVIVLSAYLGRLSTADRLLAQAVFEKPFDLDALVFAVDRLVRQGAFVGAAGGRISPLPQQVTPTAA